MKQQLKPNLTIKTVPNLHPDKAIDALVRLTLKELILIVEQMKAQKNSF